MLTELIFPSAVSLFLDVFVRAHAWDAEGAVHSLFLLFDLAILFGVLIGYVLHALFVGARKGYLDHVGVQSSLAGGQRGD